MKRTFLFALLVGGLVFSAHACFDTFLFQNSGSMVYPKNTLAVEAFGEYSYNSIAAPNDDAFFSNGMMACMGNPGNGGTFLSKTNSRDFGVALTIKGVFNFNR